MQSQGFIRARDYCFRLLRLRPRSTKEIQDKLRLKKANPEIISQVVDYLKRLDYLNDEEFCQQWLASRLNKPYGLRRIKFELKQKGIHDEIIAQKINDLTGVYSEEEVVSNIAKVRLKKFKDLSKDRAKAKVYAFLIRRGFSPDVVGDVISQL